MKRSLLTLGVVGVAIAAGAAVGIESGAPAPARVESMGVVVGSARAEKPKLSVSRYQFFEEYAFSASENSEPESIVRYEGEPGDVYVSAIVSCWMDMQDGVPWRVHEDVYANLTTAVANAGARDGYRLVSITPVERGGWLKEFQWNSNGAAAYGWGAGGGWSIPIYHVMLFEKRESNAFGR